MRNPVTSSGNSSRTYTRRKGSPLSLLQHKEQSRPSRKVYDQLDGFQKDAVNWLKPQDEAALFFEQGTGKTWITAGLIEHLTTGQMFLLIVPLANLETTWLELLPKLGVSVCTSFDAFKESGHPRKILLLHYEAIPAIIKKLRRIKWSLIVFDEAQRLKARGSLASRTAAKLRNSAQRKLILTGTPMDKNPKDLWAQFRFLKPELLGTWKEFDYKFLEQPEIELKKCRPGSFKFQMMLRALVIQKNKMKFREDMLEEFLTIIKPYCLRVTKEVLNLPTLNVTPVPITLRSEQARLYERLERTCVIDEKFSITTPLKITQLWKLHQICGGYVLDDDGEVQCVGEAKLTRLINLVHRSKPPVVIFAYYLEEIRAIHDEFFEQGYRVAVISGKNRKFRPQIIRAFQAGKIDILVCQNRSGGVGIDLFRSCTAFVYSFRHSWIDFDQLKARLHRRGQKNIVNIFLLYASGTVDEDIYYTLQDKGNLVERVLNRLRRRPNGENEGIQVRRR